MLGVKKKEDIFFDLFIEAVENISLAGAAFEDLVKNYTDVDDKVTHLKELEIAGDNVAHRLLKELNESFITPFDREDIIAITKGLDSIVDVLEKIASRFLVFNVQEIRSEVVIMTNLILSAITELDKLVHGLKTLKKSENTVRRAIIEINRLENEGDTFYREILQELFLVEKDAITLIKWQQLYELFEDGLDSCEDVANTIEGVVIKDA